MLFIFLIFFKICYFFLVSVPLEGEIEEEAPMSVRTVDSERSESSKGSNYSHGNLFSFLFFFIILHHNFFFFLSNIPTFFFTHNLFEFFFFQFFFFFLVDSENMNPNKPEDRKTGLSKISKLGRPNSNKSAKSVNWKSKWKNKK